MKSFFLITKNKAHQSIVWFRHSSRKRKIVIISVVAILFFIILGIANGNNTPQYKIEVAKKGDLTEIVIETGSVKAAGRADVYSPANGVVEELFVGNGDQVVVGQELFKVRSSATDEQKATAYASYQSALSALRTAEQAKITTQALLEQSRQAILDAENKVNYKNDNTKNPATGKDYTELEKQSIDSGLTSARETFSANEKKYKESDTAIAAAQAQVNAAWIAYQATQNVIVKAPAEGTVANVSVAQGGAVESKSPTTLVTPVLAIGSFTSTEVAVGLNETDSAKVQPGQEADIEVGSLDGKKYEGVVSRVDTIGTDNKGVMQYNAYVTILNADAQIRSGMTADVTITTKKRRDVLTVPNSSVKPYKGGRAVRVLDEKTKEVTYIPVEIGIRGKDRTEIIKGISEGTGVITALPNDQIERPSLF